MSASKPRGSCTPRTRAATTSRATFLKRLRATGLLSDACRAAKIDVAQANAWRDEDARFAATWDDALLAANDDLEIELRRRVLEGVDVTVKSPSQTSKTDRADQPVRKFNDSLLVFILKANRPEKFGRLVPASSQPTVSSIADDHDPPVIERGRRS